MINILTCTCDGSTDILLVTDSNFKADETIEKEVRNYIDTWHQGDDAEPKSVEQYYADGWTEPLKEKHQVRRWVLDEDDWYVEYAIVRMPIS